MRDHESIGGETVGGKTAACIEPEPAEPEEGRPHENEGYIMRRYGMAGAVICSPAEHYGHDQSGNTGIDMDNRTAGKIYCPYFLKETSAPHPVSHRKICQNHP